MKKKLLIILAVVVLIATASAVTYAIGPMKNMRPSDYNIGISYEQEMKSDKPAVVLFYANWCTYCKKFMPQYKLLSEVYGKDFNFVMVDIDNPKYQSIIKDYAITGFPTMFIVDPAVDNRIYLSNGLYSNLLALRTELDRFIRIRKMINIPPKKVNK